MDPWPSVSFASGKVSNTTTISDLILRSESDTCYVILTQSCFHPRDFRWPDQPSDRGILQWGAKFEHNAQVLDVVKMMRAPGMAELFDTEIQMTKRDMPEGSRLLCAIKLSSEYFEHLQGLKERGERLRCSVDSEYRLAVSVGHSMGHLGSYVLNQVMKDFWRKPVVLDARGNPDFIALSQVDSKVYEYGTKDVYRVGKSFRKLGFNVADAVAVLPEITVRARDTVERWLSLGPEVEIQAEGPALDASRRWVCSLAEEQFWMFCGGTHISNFESIEAVNLTLDYDEVAKTITLDISAKVGSGL